MKRVKTTRAATQSSKFIHVRVTPQEFREIGHRAFQRGITVSAYLRYMALSMAQEAKAS